MNLLDVQLELLNRRVRIFKQAKDLELKESAINELHRTIKDIGNEIERMKGGNCNID